MCEGVDENVVFVVYIGFSNDRRPVMITNHVHKYLFFMFCNVSTVCYEFRSTVPFGVIDGKVNEDGVVVGNISLYYTC